MQKSLGPYLSNHPFSELDGIPSLFIWGIGASEFPDSFLWGLFAIRDFHFKLQPHKVWQPRKTFHQAKKDVCSQLVFCCAFLVV